MAMLSEFWACNYPVIMGAVIGAALIPVLCLLPRTWASEWLGNVMCTLAAPLNLGMALWFFPTPCKLFSACVHLALGVLCAASVIADWRNRRMEKMYAQETSK